MFNPEYSTPLKCLHCKAPIELRVWDDDRYREQVFKVKHPRRVCVRPSSVDSIYEPDPTAVIYNNRVEVGPYMFEFKIDHHAERDLRSIEFRDHINMRVRDAVMELSLRCEFETRKNYDHPNPVPVPAPKPTFGQPPVRRLIA